MMKVYKLESYSAKKSQISTLTQLSAVLFSFIIAYQTSANETSHSRCFWNLMHNHSMLYNIVSFQFSPDIQNCI